MMIDTKLDNHILQIENELENYDVMEFKNMISSIFLNTILPTKNDLKTLSLVFRICIDYIKDNKNTIRSINTDVIKYFINNNIDNVKVVNFRTVYNVASDTVGFNIIVILKDGTETYCLNEKMPMSELKYYSMEELISKMLILTIEE